MFFAGCYLFTFENKILLFEYTCEHVCIFFASLPSMHSFVEIYKYAAKLWCAIRHGTVYARYDVQQGVTKHRTGVKYGSFLYI